MSIMLWRAPARQSSKTVREDVAHILVTSDICPQVVPRILDLIARHSLVPLTIEVCRKPQVIDLQISLERLRGNAGELLTKRIANIPTVRSVEYRTEG